MNISSIQTFYHQSTNVQLCPSFSNGTNMDLNKQNNQNNLLYAIGLNGTLAAVTLFAGIKGAKKEFAEVLKKNGISIQDGVAKIIKTGELYTGTIKRNVKHFGLKKEVVNFEKGQMKEKLYYNLLGQEVCGYFYKNGKLVKEIEVDTPLFAKNKGVVTYNFDEKERLLSSSDGLIKRGESAFEYGRKNIN